MSLTRAQEYPRAESKFGKMISAEDIANETWLIIIINAMTPEPPKNDFSRRFYDSCTYSFFRSCRSREEDRRAHYSERLQDIAQDMDRN